jgi:uncharacterized protein YbbC (DUF1343 family)
MTECAKRNIPVLILDRPNPICGEMSVVSGAILDEERYSSFVGRYALPVRYSLTCGEFANYINIVKQIDCELHVIECQGWSRSMYADETCLPWINPSPNIPGVNCAINYIGTCLIEATNVSEGRGTTRPFDIIGAPFINSYDLCQSMNSAPLEGVRFSRSFFTPMFGKYQGSACEGVQINIIDRRFYNPHATGLYLLSELCKYSEFEWKENGICLRYGTDALTVNKHFDPQAVLDIEKSGINRYIKEVSEFLIYQ